MNQLSLKTKAKAFFIFWLHLTICISAFSNDSIPPNQAFIEHCKNSNAYFLYSYTDVTYSKSWSSYKRQVSIQKTMVINNKAGVDEFAFLNLTKYVLDHLDLIEVKTLKSDGTIVKLDSSIILNHRNDEMGLTDYPIPGVESGDTIKISYLYSEYLKLNELKDFVSLFNTIPSLKTEYTIKLPHDLFVRYKLYNGFSDPQVVGNDELIYCVFSMEEIKGLKENEYACLPCELPYFYYSINTKKDEVRNWKDVYNQEFNFITQPFLIDYDKASYYGRWKRKIIGDAKDSSKYYKLNLLSTDIIENFSIEPAKANEFFKSTGYFLKEQHFDPISVRRLYRQLLEDLNIKYWAVFARSKRAGKIDPYYIRKGEYDHIFFAYENGTGSLNFLYPHDINYKYQINEIPTSLYNTEAVILQPYLYGKVKSKDKYINTDFELAEVDSVNVGIVKLPGMNANYNYSKQFFYCQVDIAQKNTTFKSMMSFSGGVSHDLRSFFSFLDKNQEISDFYSALAEYEDDNPALDIDSITSVDLKSTIPFLYSIKTKGTINNSITFLNDSLVSITLDKLIQHKEIESESNDLNYYLDYCYSDMYMIIFNFSKDIEVLSFENYNKELKNTLGEFVFQIKLISNTQLIVQSNYKITKDMIFKGELDQLKELNSFVQEIKNSRLLLKILNTPNN